MATNDKPNGERLGWALQSTSYVFENMWFKLRQDTFSRVGKGSGTYTYIEHPGSVLVVPVTRDLQVMLIRSYRFTLDSWCWEVPAGTLAGHSDVSPEAAAIRELREEAGAECSSILTLGKYYMGNGYSNHSAHFFLALRAQRVVEPTLEAFEQIDNVSLFSLSEVSDMVRDGTVNDGDSAFALLLAIQRLSSDPHLAANTDRPKAEVL